MTFLPQELFLHSISALPYLFWQFAFGFSALPVLHGWEWPKLQPWDGDSCGGDCLCQRGKAGCSHSSAPKLLDSIPYTLCLAQNWRHRSWGEPCTEWRKLWVLPAQQCWPIKAGKCWICSFDIFKRCICKLWGRICLSKGTNWQHRYNFLPVWESCLSWYGEFLAWKPSLPWRV